MLRMYTCWETILDRQMDFASLVAHTVKNHLQCRRLGLDAWVGKILRRREWQPTPVFLPREVLGWILHVSGSCMFLYCLQMFQANFSRMFVWQRVLENGDAVSLQSNEEACLLPNAASPLYLQMWNGRYERLNARVSSVCRFWHLQGVWEPILH